VNGGAAPRSRSSEKKTAQTTSGSTIFDFMTND